MESLVSCIGLEQRTIALYGFANVSAAIIQKSRHVLLQAAIRNHVDAFTETCCGIGINQIANMGAGKIGFTEYGMQ